MATTKELIDPTLTEADKAFGYKFGCDGLRKVVDAAEFLGVSRQTIYRYGVEGKVRIGNGGRVCFRSLQNHAHSLEK